MSKRFEAIIFALVFILGLILSVFVPPFQKPDEFVHFYKAETLSNGKIFCSKTKTNYGYIQKQFVQMRSSIDVLSIPFHYGGKFLYKSYLKSPFSTPEGRGVTKISVDEYCSFPTFSYIPQALGLKMAQILHLNEYFSFFAGRLAIFLLSFVWFLYLYKYSQKSLKFFLLFTYALPMTLYQLGAYSYDSVNIMLGLSLFVYLTNLIAKKKISQIDLAKLGALFLLFLLSKPGGYEPFVLFIFLIPLSKLSKSKIGYLAKTISFILIVALVYVIIRPPSSQSLTSGLDIVTRNPSLQLKNILTYPINYVFMLFNTFKSLGEFYLRSLIGKLGWLDYDLEYYLYYGFVGLFFFIVAKTELPKDIRLSTSRIVFFFISVLGFLALITTIFYLAWTPVGYDYASGSQGRYFITLIPFILLGLISIKYNKKLTQFLIIIGILSIIFSITESTYKRYFDYSELYSDIKQLDVYDKSKFRLYKITNAMPIKQVVKLQNGKKLAAINFYLRNLDGKVVDPYIVEVMDMSCKKVLQTKFVNLSEVGNGQYLMKINRISANKTPSVCISLRPFDKLKHRPLETYTEKGSPVLLPMYLR
ncbi:DUF2142 domain-containing protein [Patescibacteria group bacterium]|nr:DUF2142 domain-containing protein [Patescibacteria group bacterium]